MDSDHMSSNPGKPGTSQTCHRAVGGLRGLVSGDGSLTCSLWKGQGDTRRGCHPVLRSCVANGQHARFRQCFSYFRIWLIGFPLGVYFSLGVTIHFRNHTNFFCAIKWKENELGNQARPGFEPWANGLCLTFFIWKMGKQWAPPGRIMATQRSFDTEPGTSKAQRKCNLCWAAV